MPVEPSPLESPLKVFFTGSPIKQTVLETLADALTLAAPQLNQLSLTPEIWSSLKLERPKNREHGDYAVNISFLSKLTRMAPPVIAQEIASHIQSQMIETQVIGGFLNFKLGNAVFLKSLVTLLKTPEPGKNKSLAVDSF
ncbi:MAG: hypothetical protein K2X66_13965, partial [Cyanobacteria bacterium]|nr:hypothetical protein [Cyanobacteriota bacterium]